MKHINYILNKTAAGCCGLVFKIYTGKQLYRKLYSEKSMDIFEACEDISDAEGWGSIRRLKRTEACGQRSP
ncbi:hypothetical protein AMQ84_00320 [Paenibacillus riograndensis]|uniref:Uncharacterized protein n=1 Tax=Paenibacillus riograndensis TaxID=483937 RepID=A0A132UCS8_9BACL|nr:hypothetical protein AMQ84_00320 [Paenibacillus riograndensis]